MKLCSNSHLPLSALTASLLLLTGCGSSSDDDDSTGLIKFYNAASDSPSLFLTLDENLDDDPDDEFENTFNSVSFGRASAASDVPTARYFYEIAWQEGDSIRRDELSIISEGQLDMNSDTMTFVVMSGSVTNPDVNIYLIPELDNDDDIDNDTFNLQILNTHPDYPELDVYMSDTDETFNEAFLIDTAIRSTWTDNIKLDEDEYTVYLTLPGDTEVLFESTELSYLFNTQYFLAIRPNVGGSGNPFELDSMTFNNFESAADENSQARIRFYNGIHAHEALADYSQQVEFTVEDVTSAEIVVTDMLNQYELSDATITEPDDFRLSLEDAISDTMYLENALFSVPENTARTIFFYVDEVYVDDDGDGDIDEDGDGQIDEIDAEIKTVVVEDDTREGLFDRQISIVNLADNEEFDNVEVYFVKSDETIATATSQRRVGVGVHADITLRNNTYDVFAVTEIDNQDVILDSFSLTLDENTAPQFLLLEHSDTSSSGYAMRLLSQ
jgi:hypothetical protein